MLKRRGAPAIMLNDPEKNQEAESIEVRCYFVRERNALAVRGEFTPLYTDYYLHLMQHQIRPSPEFDQALKTGLAAVTLHLASRPRNEAVAWTLNWQDPLHNLFVTGSNRLGNVTGRVFEEDIRPAETNLFFSQTTAGGQGDRQSTIEAPDRDMFQVAEAYYRQSEQRLARFFRHGEEDFVLVTAQPDCDLPWLESLDDDAIRSIDAEETLSLLEKRFYRFDCGCTLEKIFAIVSRMTGSTIDEVFGNEEVTVASCPRCGARYALTREALEAYQANPPQE